MKKVFFVIINSLLSIIVFSQHIENVRAIQDDNKIIIYYDILGSNAGQTFYVKAYCSSDGGNTWGNPLYYVSQEAGPGITGGYNKKIIWDVLSEVPELKGNNIKFEVRATYFDNSIISAQSGSFTDNRDGQKYNWIKIGDQVWMAENLKYQTNSGSWCYDDNSMNCNVYGPLYNYQTANSVCPQGWHLPSDLEWTVFENNLRDGKMNNNISLNDILMLSTKPVNALIASKFDAKLAGWRSYKGSYYRLGFSTNFWTSSIESKNYAWSRKIDNSNQYIYRDSYDKESGFSVRCIKDK